MIATNKTNEHEQRAKDAEISVKAERESKVNGDIRNAYNEWSASYDEDENLTRDLDYKVIREALADRHFNSILEIGCGTGKNTVFLARISTMVHAIDFSQGMVDRAMEKIEAKNVHFSIADLTKQWPGGEEKYDLIVCSLILEHIENVSHIFAEAERVLVRGGRLFINELHPFRQYRGTRARFVRGGRAVEVNAFVHHISDFTNAALSRGLKLVKLNEHWHKDDIDKPPRLLSFTFQKEGDRPGN